MLRQLIAIIVTTLSFGAFAATDANQASQAELESLKGIGTKMSSRIVDARKAGSFKDWNDMVERVAGVGPGNAARLSQAGLTVGGASYNKTATAAAPTQTRGSKAPAKAADQPRKSGESRKSMS